MQKCQLLRPPSESYMRWLGRKSANRWRREAHYCTILHCKSVQYSASERRRLADFWPSNLIYDSDGGLKSWYFCIRLVVNLDQKSYQWTLITYVLNILFSRTCKILFFVGNEFMLMTELADHNWSMYAWRTFSSGKQVFWRLRQLLPYGFCSSGSRLRKFLLFQELRRFAYI